MAADTGNLGGVYAATTPQPLRPEYREPREWFGLLMAPNSEKRAYERLVRMRFVPYWPTFVRQLRLRGNRHRAITVGVLPGYMLLPLAIGEDVGAIGEEIIGDRSLERSGIIGIRDWLRYGNGNIAKLTNEEVERIRRTEAALNSAEVCAQRSIPFQVGQIVRVIDDLLSPWYGPIEQIDNEFRIKLSNMAMWGIPMWVKASQIEVM